MGLEDEVEVTDDIGTADAILACSYEMKQNPWIRGVAKFHHLPIFVMKVSSYVIISNVYMTVLVSRWFIPFRHLVLFCSQTQWHKWSRQFV